MIDSIKNVGDYIIESSGKSIDDPLLILIQDPASSNRYKHVLCIILQQNENGFTYVEVRHEEYRKDYLPKYLYRKGDSRGTDLTPTSRVTDIEKTFRNKFVKWFSNILKDKDLELTAKDNTFFKELDKCIKLKSPSILEDLKNAGKNIKADESGILTLIIKDGSREQYIGEIQSIISIFRVKTIRKYYNKYNVQSKAQNKVCSVCRNLSEEVYGFVDTYKFYTVDKIGFIPGGFEQQHAWKNFPVCFKCAITLEAGKKHIEDFFTYKSYGFNYFIIPKLLNPQKGKEVYNEFETFKKELDKPSTPITKRMQNLFSESEEDILYLLAQKENYLNLNLMFYEKDNAAFRILLLIEDVFPSHLNHLFSTKEKVDNKSLYNGEYEFTFKNIWHFFPRKSDENLNLSKYFLELTYSIFSNKKICYKFLLWRFIRKIRIEFANNVPTKRSTFLAWQLLDYLNLLNLLKNVNKGEVNMQNKPLETGNEIKKDFKERIDKVFLDYPVFFKENQLAKRAIFLEGIITQKLLNIQYIDRKATPFRTKLHGLKLNERLVKRLLPEIQNKLEEYKKNYYRDLEQLIAYYFVKSGENWKLTNDEISFYFVLGMNLHNLIDKQEKKNDQS